MKWEKENTIKYFDEFRRGNQPVKIIYYLMWVSDNYYSIIDQYSDDLKLKQATCILIFYMRLL